MKLSNTNRTLVIAAAAMAMSAYQLSPFPAWACSASSSGEFSYSSNTGPTSVTVCAKVVTASRTVTATAKTPAVKAPVTKAPVAQPAPKPAPKTTPAPVKSLLTPLKQGVPAALQKPVAKPTAKPTPKPVVAPIATKTPEAKGSSTSAISSATSSGEVSFTPAPISLVANVTRAFVGQDITFWANASTHYKSGILLGKATDVRFTPIQTLWSSDDGQTAVGGSNSMAFENAGSVEVAAIVTYAVAYQIAGASGWVSSGEISVSDSISLSIEELPSATATADVPPAKVVRLVGKNCLSQAVAFGCNP